MVTSGSFYTTWYQGLWDCQIRHSLHRALPCAHSLPHDTKDPLLLPFSLIYSTCLLHSHPTPQLGDFSLEQERAQKCDLCPQTQPIFFPQFTGPEGRAVIPFTVSLDLPTPSLPESRPPTSGISTTHELARNVDSQAPPP